MNRYRKGGPMDDVANNIRAEQMADAAPSAAEAEEMHRDFLREEGCLVCGESDPDELTVVMASTGHNCKAHQYPGYPDPSVFCTEHERPGSVLGRAKLVQRARNNGAVAMAVFDCGMISYAQMPEVPESRKGPGFETWSDVPPSHRPIPEVDIRCRCGSGIDEIVYLEGA